MTGKQKAILGLSLCLFCAAVAGCLTTGSKDQTATFAIDYEKYVLANGLEVILHEDHSDPVVAVATMMHVGSARENPGRTGFAHFFEHMSFNDSENVPRGANRKYIPELGGSRNGGTWNDGTVFYEVVPTDAFEKILWIDSDRLGFMINTVTEEALQREKQVVKNEKRQNYDNKAYGYTNEVILSNLYPADHPYSWTVIGSLADLEAATLNDVKEFYSKYYGPNNATLVIAGDIDIARTKELVEQWFGEIKPGPEVTKMAPRPVTLEAVKSVYHADNFAKLPELNMVFPTVESLHKDQYSLEILASILAGSKQSPLYKVIVEEQKLAPDVSAYQNSGELAGTFEIDIRANNGVDLDAVKVALEDGLNRFKTEGFSDNELKRIKARIKTGMYQGISTVLNKAFTLSTDNEFNGDPSYITKQAALIQAVNREDIMDVFNRYIVDRNYILTSFVPRDQIELAVDGATRAAIVEEEYTEGAEHEQVSQGAEAVYEKTVTKHDRSEPALGTNPLLKTPALWRDNLGNDLQVLGIQNSEVPLVSFNLKIDGGHWLDSLDKPGVASLVAGMMMQGTATKTAAELEEAIGLLGASINVRAGQEEITISASTLADNFEPTLALVEEIILHPRWDVDEFDRLQRELKTRLKGNEANPRSVTFSVMRDQIYGKNHIMGTPQLGTLESAAKITLDDLKAYYNRNLSPSLTTFHIAGDVSQDRAVKALKNLESGWAKKAVDFPKYAIPEQNKGGSVYFIDIPDAKQSTLVLGNLALSGLDPDYNNLVYANQLMGGGASARLFQLLRIEKGFTYGAYSWINRSKEDNMLMAYSSVRSNATLESLQLIRGLLQDYVKTFGETEMQTVKNQTIKRHTSAFESLQAKMNMLENISTFKLSDDYLKQNQEELLNMKLTDFHAQMTKHMQADDFIYLVVGDATTQLEKMLDLGLGAPQVLDIHGQPVQN